MKKNRSCIGIIFLMLMVCTSCIKNAEMLSQDGESSILKSIPVENVVKTIDPSGGDDTELIETSLLEAIEAGPGSVVQFTEGTFYISRHIEVEGFDGYIKGAGKDKTIITKLPGSKIDGVVGVWDMALSSVFTFYGGNIQVSDLTFEITDSEPAGNQEDPPDKPGWWGGALAYLIEITVKDDQSTVSSSFDNVAFIGAPGNFGGYNIAHCVNIAHPLGIEEGGSHCLTNCDFTYSFRSYQGHGWEDHTIKNGTWLIGGSPNSGNCFEHCRYGVTLEKTENSEVEISYNTLEQITMNGIHIYENGNSKVEISYNTIESSGLNGVIILQDEITEPSSYIIEHNNLEIEGEIDGIAVMDIAFSVTGKKAIDARISSNIISMNNYHWGGIYIEGHGMKVLQNSISGVGFAGVYSKWGSKLVIIQNNVQDVTPVEDDELGLGAQIWLGWDTQDCVVVSGPIVTNVVNYGTDNKITAANITTDRAP